MNKKISLNSFPWFIFYFFANFFLISLTKKVQMLHTTWCSSALLECIFVKKREKRVLFVLACCHQLTGVLRDGAGAPKYRRGVSGSRQSLVRSLRSLWQRQMEVEVVPAAPRPCSSWWSAGELCLCEIHWMYPPLSPRGSASQRGLLGLDGAADAGLSKPLCVCARDYQLDLFVCVGTPS